MTFLGLLRAGLKIEGNFLPFGDGILDQSIPQLCVSEL